VLFTSHGISRTVLLVEEIGGYGSQAVGCDADDFGLFDNTIRPGLNVNNVLVTTNDCFVKCNMTDGFSIIESKFARYIRKKPTLAGSISINDKHDF